MLEEQEVKPLTRQTTRLFVAVSASKPPGRPKALMLTCCCDEK
jgi:hypothetical protein